MNAGRIAGGRSGVSRRAFLTRTAGRGRERSRRRNRVAAGRLRAAPRSLTSTCVLSTYLDHGLKELQLPVAAAQLWEQAWRSVSRRRTALPAEVEPTSHTFAER